MDTQLSSQTTSVCSEPNCRDFATDVLQWNHVSGINNPSVLGTRATYVHQHKRSEWLTGLEGLKQPENEWPEHVNLELTTDEQNEQMAFLSRIKEKESIVLCERFSNFNRLVSVMAYVQHVFNKLKPATETPSVD